MDELKKKFDELMEAVTTQRKANDERLAQLEKKGSADAMVVEKMEKANAEISRLQGEIDGMKTAMNRTNQNGAGSEKEQAEKSAKEMKQAFDKYLRKGDRAMSDAEMKTLSVQSDPDGGFLVLPEMSAEIVKKVFESSPMRAIASVQSISTDELDILQDLDQVGSGWVEEQGARASSTSPQFKFSKIPTKELYSNVPVTQKLLDDASIDMEAYIVEKCAEKFGRDEATAFVTGNGVGKPMGFASYPSGTSYGQIEQIGSGSSSVFVADKLISLAYALKAPYAKNATWLMTRTSEGLVRQLKDSQNRYLWEPGLNGQSTGNLLGHPIMWAADMAEAGANSLSAAFGDFKQGYQIVDRIGIRMLRDPYTSKPNVLFYNTKRVGGAVKNFEAIKLYKLG
jgi:HK97 family phage major capsid protein